MNLAPHATACLHWSRVMTVPAPTSMSGQLSATALMESRGGGGAEGDLHDVDAAGEHGLGGGDGVLGVLNDHHGHHAGVPQSL